MRDCGVRSVNQLSSGANFHESFHVQDLGQNRTHGLLHGCGDVVRRRLLEEGLRAVQDFEELSTGLHQALLCQDREDQLTLSGRLHEALLQEDVIPRSAREFKPCAAPKESHAAFPFQRHEQ